MQKRLECKVSGRVQMVMFRDFVQRAAEKLSIVGTVQNIEDGTVYIKAEGNAQMLQEFLTFVRRGPMFARVDSVTETWTEPLGGYKSFDILY